MYITTMDNDEVHVYPLLPERQWYLVFKVDDKCGAGIYLGNEYGESLLTKGDILRAKWPSKQITDVDVAAYYGAIIREMAEQMVAGVTCIDMDTIADAVLPRYWEYWVDADEILAACEGVCP